ncbi:hypothetical protein QVD17_32491 [Tagetes erecta]|uniref:Uncharacterized protein n=1 Tax=Tagetes erecta TaxID=13708 RepID=A0AAD8JYF9_TARER|nr:hypothetical protein QVD17_32491 [Tagetes erecta]
MLKCLSSRHLLSLVGSPNQNLVGSPNQNLQNPRFILSSIELNTKPIFVIMIVFKLHSERFLHRSYGIK